MTDMTEELSARLAAVEIMLGHLIAEASIREPNGPAAGLVAQAVKEPRPMIVPTEADRALMKGHLDLLLRTSARMRRDLEAG